MFPSNGLPSLGFRNKCFTGRLLDTEPDIQPEGPEFHIVFHCHKGVSPSPLSLSLSLLRNTHIHARKNELTCHVFVHMLSLSLMADLKLL
jgi:hypothetical protein